MDNHLTNIEIKNFKCFKDFKADGFKRVNLIGGNNNVGKTAFMEACYLGISTRSDAHKFFNSLLVVELSRNQFMEFEIIKDTNNFEFKYDNSELKINDELCHFNNSVKRPFGKATKGLYTKPSKDYHNGIDEIMQFYRGSSEPLDIKNTTFISMNGIRDNYLADCIDDIKLSNKWDIINKQLEEIFNIKKIDVIKNTVMLEYESEYLKLYEFGDGLKHFISILISINLNKDSIIFLDEVDNGIHYTNFDELWEIILKISKKQEVQVFATTHSKECIDSFARVSKKLEDEDISYVKITKLDDNNVMAGVRNYDMIQDSIEDNHELRGW
ncbi:MAG: AAA family ATPase [Campylobacterota bacterium]|nr:AAA family ATPase [Campylobacterota bacterium]